MDRVSLSTKVRPITKKRLDDYCNSYKRKKKTNINKFDIIDEAINAEIDKRRQRGDI